MLEPSPIIIRTHRRQELPSLTPGGDVVAYRLSAPAGDHHSRVRGSGGRGDAEGGKSCSEEHRSDIMLDVAMATASLGTLQLGDMPESLHLDLSDGPSHMIGAAAAMGLHNLQMSFTDLY